MSNANAARLFGDDYQAMVFWKYANEMLRADSEIESIGYEYDKYKSFDDIIIHYRKPQKFSSNRLENITKDYIQVKFHMSQSGMITIDKLLDPEFIGAKKYSFMDKVLNAYRKDSGDFYQSRFILYNSWDIDQNDALYQCIDNIGRGFRMQSIFEGKTSRSKSWRIREQFKQALSIDDDELYIILDRICIYSGKESIEEMEEKLNSQFRLNNLQTFSYSKNANPYIDLIRTWVKRGKKIWTSDEIWEQCKAENLISADNKKRRILIRSFERYIEEENSCDILDLLSYFDGCFLKEGYNWENISQVIVDFVKENIGGNESYYLEWAAHYSVAFMVGRVMNTVQGIKTVMVQKSVHGNTIWDTTNSEKEDYNTFSVDFEDGDDSAEDVVLTISVTNWIEEEVKEYIRASEIEFRRMIHCRLPKVGINSIKSGAHAWSLTEQIDGLMRSRTVNEKKGTLHIFVSAPVSFIFYLGKMSRSYGSIQLYEYNLKDKNYYLGSGFPLSGEL